MFELKDHLQHPGIWGKFFADALPGTYMAWAHCTDYHACEHDYSLKMLKFRLVPTTFSQRGADLVSPYVHMIRIALAETAHLAKAGIPEKFIVISDATLPVKPFSFVHWAQTKDGESDFCISTTTAWAFAVVEGETFTLVKHHQWVSLNRSDAEVLARNWNFVKQGWHWNVTLRSGKFATRPRVVPRTIFQNGTWFTATDEEAVYERVVGPMLLRNLSDRSPMMDLFTNRRCLTYVDWPTNADQDEVEPHQVPVSALQLGAAQSQFFDATQTVSLKLLKDKEMQFSIQNGIMHPYRFERMGIVGLRVLRNSPYLFARKFADCAVLPNFTDIMFS